jgi:hypothetical protein
MIKNLTDYQIEDIFENVVESKQNEQILDSNELLKLRSSKVILADMAILEYFLSLPFGEIASA